MTHLQLEAWASEEGFQPQPGSMVGEEGWKDICVLQGLGGRGCLPYSGLMGNPLASPSRTPRGALGGPTAPERL